jgi:hypothetical protein
MEENEILESLCYYDKRNPDCTANDEDIEEHNDWINKESKKRGYWVGCSCDNCFYGRTKLAEYILKLNTKTK